MACHNCARPTAAARISQLLRERGYPGAPDFVLQGGQRSLASHLWLDACSRPIPDFFATELAARSK